MNKILFTMLSVVTLISCETTIHPELNNPENIMVIDAWVTQKLERQEIRITRSQSYFDNSLPEKIPGAIVVVEDVTDGTIYNFQEGAEAYYWDPVTNPFGTIGHMYRLSVTLSGETFEAYSKLGRVPDIDSIKFQFSRENLLISKDHYLAEFSASEPEGVGDTYWIKAWKNGVYLGKPGELNMTYDASFTPGQSVDGQQFIIPIRKDFVNPLDQNPDKDNEFLPPYMPGDSLYVEIHSIDHAAYDFLFGVYFHINRPGGFAELFAQPLANAITNLKSTDGNSTTRVAGFLNVAAVSSRGQRLTQEIADEAMKNAE